MKRLSVQETIPWFAANLCCGVKRRVLTPSVYGTPTTTWKGSHNVVIDPDLGVGIRFYGNNIGEECTFYYIFVQIASFLL